MQTPKDRKKYRGRLCAFLRIQAVAELRGVELKDAGEIGIRVPSSNGGNFDLLGLQKRQCGWEKSVGCGGKTGWNLVLNGDEPPELFLPGR